MSISAFCIRRPVFTILLMAALFVGGIAGYRQLPVSALPRVDYPTITVSASLSGAAPETMASAVATPLERQFSTIPGVSSMSSSSTLGSTSITLQFDLSRDIDGAALDVQTAISATLRRLPKEMTTPPSFRKVNPADAPVLFIAVSSDTLPISQVNDYADTVLAQKISTVTGVAQVQVFGERKYAVRIKVDPSRLASQNLSFDDVREAVSAAASNAPVGLISGPKQLFNLQVAGQPKNAEGFRDMIVAWKNAAPIRLKDIADVTDGVQNERSAAAVNGRPAVVLAISRQPDANTIEVVKSIRALLPSFRQQLPPSVELTPLFDRSVGVRDAVHDVEVTLFITIALVIAVIFLFLRNARATLIPALAVPLSITATFGVMALLGFSINNVSLLALTLCVGFIVDDAIVMLENIMRHIEEGMQPFEAALKGAREIGFTIVSITLSLVAVFIPVLFMGGVVGRVLNEFAVTISAAILISGLVSLTLTPMLCAKILKKDMHEKAGAWAEGLEKAFQRMLRGYDASLQWCLDHRRTMLAVTLLTVVLSVAAFMAVPKGFFPIEDTSFLSGSTEAAQDTSYEAMLQKQARVAEIVRADPAVETVLYSVGGGRSYNTGRLHVALKPKRERAPAGEVIGRLRKAVTSQVEGLNVFLQPVQNIQIGGRASKSMYQYTLMGSDLRQLYDVSEKLRKELEAEKGFIDVTSDLEVRSLEARVTPDRDKAYSLGLTNEGIRSGLYNAFGDLQIGSIFAADNDYAIIIGVTDERRKPCAAERRRRHRALARPPCRQPPGADACRDDLLQPRGRPLARHRRGEDQRLAEKNTNARRRHGQLPRQRASVPGHGGGPGRAHRRYAHHHLHHPRHAVRELRPPRHHTLRSALCGHRRRAFPCALRHGPQRHRHRRRHPAHRHRQEKRHHDGRLRHRRARGGQTAGRGHLSGLPPPLPPHHDDDFLRHLRHAPHRARCRRGRGAAPAAWRQRRGRPAHLAAADALHHARRLSLP
jgi:HAE1 family hydrophobic/amphiphilic exporter-1